jgi:hypothetical protein
LNPRPLDYESTAANHLSYRPQSIISYFFYFIFFKNYQILQ